MNRLLERIIVTLSGMLHSKRRFSKESIKYGSHSVNIFELYLHISSKLSIILTKLKRSVFSNAHPSPANSREFMLVRIVALMSSAKLPGLVQGGLYLLL